MVNKWSFQSNQGKRKKLYKANRKCLYQGCNAILNRYNPENYCYVHQRKRWFELGDEDKGKIIKRRKNERKRSIAQMSNSTL